MQQAAQVATTTAERIADTALRILEDQGPDAVSMRRVAQAVGITPMAIYHHFASRETLLNAITDREFAKLLDYMQAHALRGSMEARLLTVMEGYIDYALARPRVFDYVFSSPRPGARQYPQDFREGKSPTLNLVAQVVRSAMDSGYLSRADVWDISFALWAHVHGFVMLYRAGRIALPEKEFRQLIRRSLRSLVHGLRAK
jgi:AcrR family transcriptional regulator